MMSIGSCFLQRAVAVAAGAMLLASAAPISAMADDGPVKPSIDCSKAANKKKPACKPHLGASDDAIINGAYWLAHAGQLKESLALLATVQDPETPRVLNAKGFATRKLGDVDAALPYYARALEIEPNYVQAREYLGEAFLAKGDLARATEQLGEIERRCGTDCVAFTALKSNIATFAAAQSSRG